MVLRLSVGLSLVALLVLAGIQYHWIGQIAVAERQRLERGVAEASSDLAEDFTSELRNLAGIFEPRFSPMPPDPISIATRYHYWATYGSPEIDRKPVKVTSAKWSEDGKTLTIESPGLVKDRICEIRLRGVESADGEPRVHP